MSLGPAVALVGPEEKERNIMPPSLRRNRARSSGRAAAVAAVERALNRDNFITNSTRVASSVAIKAEVQDRIRARSLAGTTKFVLR